MSRPVLCAVLLFCLSGGAVAWDGARWSEDNWSAQWGNYFPPDDSAVRWGNLTDARGTHGTTFALELGSAWRVFSYIVLEEVWVERLSYEEYALPIALVAADDADLGKLIADMERIAAEGADNSAAMEQQLKIKREEVVELEKLTTAEKAQQMAAEHVEGGGVGRGLAALAGGGFGWIANDQLEDKDSREEKTQVNITGSNNDLAVGDGGDTSQSNDGNADRADGVSNQDVDNK
ncbi:MAG: hypothetical protein OES34_11650 [Nitrosopumilus sp.]|nr:hypothetical protein [Nitrosopumilus sp.]